MTRDHIISFCFIALLLYVVFHVFVIFAPFFQPIFWGAILAFGFYPVYATLLKRFRGRETLAALLTTVVIILLIAPLIAIIVGNVATQAVQLYQFVTDYIRAGHLEKLIDQMKTLAIVERIKANSDLIEPLKENATEWVLSSSKALTNFSVAKVGIITKNLFFVIMNLLLIAFLTFILLKDGGKIYEFIFRISPLEEENKRAIFGQINETFSAVIRGQILTSLTQSVIAGTAFWLLGLPLPIFFAVATFVTAMVPMVGAAGIWFPFFVYLIIVQSYVKAVILFLVGVFGISLIDNILKPALIGEKTKLPYFLLFFGMLGGIKAYGIMGIFLAPVILSLFFALIKIYQEKFS